MGLPWMSTGGGLYPRRCSAGHRCRGCGRFGTGRAGTKKPARGAGRCCRGRKASTQQIVQTARQDLGRAAQVVELHALVGTLGVALEHGARAGAVDHAGDAAAAAIDLRAGRNPPARRLVIDAISGASEPVRIERSAECPGCGPFPTTPRIIRTRNRWCPRVEGIPGDRRLVDQTLHLSDRLRTTTP